MSQNSNIIIKNIYYMLTYAFQELRKNDYKDIASEKFDNIYDLFAEILLHGISHQLKQGLHRTYVNKNDYLNTLRGKIDINNTLRKYSAGIHALACEFDEFSENNLFNQILKSTIRLVIKQSQVKYIRKSALLKLLPYFANIDYVDLTTVKWTHLRFDRNSKTYEMLIYLCYFVANNLLLTTDEGFYHIHSFSDDKMCRLYEKFILEFYKRHHPYLKPCAKQISWNIIEEESTSSILPIMQTDIHLCYNGRTLIIDAKYYTKSMGKYYDKLAIHSHNQYQILSYVLNHDKNHSGTTDGMLLYAKTDEEITPNGHMKWKDGNMIYYRTLDLNCTFEQIKKQLDSIPAETICAK